MQSLNRGQNAFGETATGGAVIAEAAFAPKHCWTHHPFGVIVGWFNAFNGRECPQRVVDFQQSPAKALGFIIHSDASTTERFMETDTYRLEVRVQNGAVDVSGFKILPNCEDFFHCPCACLADALGRITQVEKLLKIALEMRPADLTQVRREFGVGSPAVRANNADDFPQQRLQSILAAFGMDLEYNDTHRGRRPKPTQLTALRPPCFIHVLNGCGAHGGQCFGMWIFQGLTHFFFKSRHAAQGNRQIENSLGNLLNGALAAMASSSQVRQCGCKIRSDSMIADALGDFLARDLPATGTSAGIYP